MFHASGDLWCDWARHGGGRSKPTALPVGRIIVSKPSARKRTCEVDPVVAETLAKPMPRRKQACLLVIIIILV